MSFEKCCNFYPNNFKFCAVKKNYIKLLLLVLPKKFWFAANGPNLGGKMLVVGTLNPISRNFLNLAIQKCSVSTPKI